MSPSSIPLYGEEFLTINGTDLAGTVSTTVVYDGLYQMEPSLISSTQLFVFVATQIMATPGPHTVTVLSDDGAVVRTHGPATFTIAAPPIAGPPLLGLPEVVVAEATSPAGANATYATSAISLNGDPVPVTCSPASGSLFPLGVSSVNCSATDAGGTTAGSFTVFVSDTVSPLLTLPGDITSATQVVTFTATATDAIDGALPVSCSPASGSTFAFGNTTVVCSATDNQTNSRSGSFNVFVTGGPPVLTVPPDIVTEATGPAGAEVTFEVTAVDATSVSCSPPSGSTFPLGTTTVDCTASNAAGSTSAEFDVTVEDTTPPELTLPSIVEAEATSPAGATVTFVATAEDLVDGPRPVDCTPASGSLFPLGSTTVICTSSDTRDNLISGSFDVVVEDTTAPTITVATANPSSLWPPNHKMVPIALTVEATDAVDPSPSIQIVSVSSNQPVNGTGDGDTAPDWVITGPLSLQLRAERAGNSERIYTITVSATDLYGNVSTATIAVSVAQSRRSRGIH
ncbi:MAG: HYR domain-containing protein [Thermoanaerobaculia bacterium]